jgi:enoyl-CoA hydratase/carnithine racemase
VGINAKMSDLSVTLGDDHVADVTLQRPPDKFIDVDLARAIADAILALDAEPECRAIVLSSTGKHFCAGARPMMCTE